MVAHTASSIRIAVVAAALVASAFAPTSFAQMPPNNASRSVTVDYSDLNLATNAGSRALYQRLVLAARQVCPDSSDTFLGLRQNQDAQRCITRALEQAVKDIKHPKLVQVASSYALKRHATE